jgi:hypothetical protein
MAWAIMASPPTQRRVHHDHAAEQRPQPIFKVGSGTVAAEDKSRSRSTASAPQLTLNNTDVTTKTTADTASDAITRR